MTINGARVLAVIPARGGSRRVPRKNIKFFKGRPLIGWTIDAARSSRLIDKTVLSTEDAEIKLAALKLGAEVIDRPGYLATDTAANEDVMRHALTVYPAYDWVVLLQPCSPLRQSADIDACLALAADGDCICISVRENGTKNGAVYVMKSALLERGHNFNSNRLDTVWYWMPDARSLDIDEPENFNA